MKGTVVLLIVFMISFAACLKSKQETEIDIEVDISNPKTAILGKWRSIYRVSGNQWIPHPDNGFIMEFREDSIVRYIDTRKNESVSEVYYWKDTLLYRAGVCFFVDFLDANTMKHSYNIDCAAGIANIPIIFERVR
jgi:hypothetical protein